MVSLTAVGAGSSTLTATVGAFNSTNSVTITVAPLATALIHRYSFTNGVSDSVGGADGSLNGDATASRRAAYAGRNGRHFCVDSRGAFKRFERSIG